MQSKIENKAINQEIDETIENILHLKKRLAQIESDANKAGTEDHSMLNILLCKNNMRLKSLYRSFTTQAA